MKYSDLKFGKMEAVVNKLGGMDGVRRFLAGELVVERRGIAPASPGAKIVPPVNGRIYQVRVRVDYARPWREAVLAAGPNTLDNYDVLRVGDQYPPEPASRRSIRWAKIILVNFGPGSVSQSATVLEWGKAQHLRPAIPRGVFAIGEHCPNLNSDLGLEHMAVVSSARCSFVGELRVPCVWWDRSRRESYLYWFVYDWDEDYWFAFVRE